MKWAVLSLVVTATVAVACGARTGLDAPTPSARGGAGGTGQGGTPTGSGGTGGTTGTGGTGGQAPPDDCADAGTTFIYVVTGDRQIYAFDPPSASFASLGMLPCGPEGAQSMAVDRSGHAYVESNAFDIYRVSLADLSSCQKTHFSDFGKSQFGMAFSADNDGGGETLFLAGQDSAKNELVSVNVDTFNVHVIGDFSANVGDAELTGTGDGRLYAYGVDGPMGQSHLAELDKSTAAVLSDMVLPFEGNNAWAFAWWGGDFYFFTSTGGASKVRRLDPTSGDVTVVATAPGEVVGAGVSTCAPVD